MLVAIKENGRVGEITKPTHEFEFNSWMRLLAPAEQAANARVLLVQSAIGERASILAMEDMARFIRLPSLQHRHPTH